MLPCGRPVVSGRGEEVSMSVQPRPWPEVPEQTAVVARAAFGGRQRTDSTHVLAAVRSVDRLEFLAETLRAALEALAAAAPDWLSARIDAEWVRRYGARMDSYRLPKGDDKRTKMAVQVGTDGFSLLEAIHAADAPVWLREIPAVIILRTVWIKQYHRT